MKNYILLFAMILGVISCTKDEVEVYSAARYLFFPNSTNGVDTIAFSFSHYPGETSKEVAFPIALTGLPLDEALEYKLEVVDSLTTASQEDYELAAPLMFAANTTVDTLKIVCKNVREELTTQKVQVTYRIVVNENFAPGLSDKQMVRVIFENIKSAPLWWQPGSDVEKLLLGKWSAKKFEYFVIATGENDCTGMSMSEIRELTMIFKKYLLEHDIKEEDGTPMVEGIPAY